MHDMYTNSHAGTLNRIDICGQLAKNPHSIECLADMLEAEEFIASDTAQAVKADSKSSPYARASRLIGPAIECVNHNQEKHNTLVQILKHFNISI